jgi:hypothetical protein
MLKSRCPSTTDCDISRNWTHTHPHPWATGRGTTGSPSSMRPMASVGGRISSIRSCTISSQRVYRLNWEKRRPQIRTRRGGTHPTGHKDRMCWLRPHATSGRSWGTTTSCGNSWSGSTLAPLKKGSWMPSSGYRTPSCQKGVHGNNCWTG